MCKKTEGSGKKKRTIWDTSCIYGGDPHSCDKYNKNGQQKFYDGLLSSMANAYCSANLGKKACLVSTTFHSSTICTEIAYTFNRQ
jgi:hypothetical protein